MADLFPEITYEGGTDGNAVGAESGWDTNSPAGAYAAAAAMVGSMGMRITGQGVHRKTITARTNGRIRWYYRVPVITSSSNVTIVPFRNASTVLTGVRHETTGSLCIVSGGSKVGSSTGLLVASEPIRGEFGWSTDGSAVLELWRGANIHSTGAPDESVSVPAASWAGTAGDNIGACWPNLVTGFVSDWDCVRVTDDPATRIGPGLILPTGTWTYSRRVQIGA